MCHVAKKAKTSSATVAFAGTFLLRFRRKLCKCKHCLRAGCHYTRHVDTQYNEIQNTVPFACISIDRDVITYAQNTQNTERNSK
jgi:hypothetical protein